MSIVRTIPMFIAVTVAAMVVIGCFIVVYESQKWLQVVGL